MIDLVPPRRRKGLPDCSLGLYHSVIQCLSVRSFVRASERA